MSLASCLLGTAFGDALGLPYEGVSPQRARRLLGPPDRYRLIFGRGMISDDTEHACITAQALIASGGEPHEFTTQLARRLRRWLFALPPGIGFATLRAIAKTAIGIPPERSGVFSAGNGPAMRAAILGAAVNDVARRAPRTGAPRAKRPGLPCRAPPASTRVCGGTAGVDRPRCAIRFRAARSRAVC